MVDQPLSSGGAFNTTPGNTFNMLAGERVMKGFPVTEDELETIALFNTQTQVFFSVATFFASLAISALWDAAFAESLTPAGQLLNKIGPWVFGVVALAFGFLGWRSQRARGGMIERIKAHTSHKDQD